ncbi:CheC, inhibitor of MCP methylation [Desulforamulus reducens MI-1]|uniref:CheC, inhibitor of MCP methylation n=1 Tax=Desulforamulus reducens (strain ATCC BAA-1160 / DSM 100696 / MI-1) TaxID=349161 RepID=A4J737_DESRM|nr:flagellar motor switch phosphatase FliY [Desulforamulus reducens]ABO50890.1 CheC, inhibitor of MCP methylation [Desulforamulus reducens MI-1]
MSKLLSQEEIDALMKGQDLGNEPDPLGNQSEMSDTVIEPENTQPNLAKPEALAEEANYCSLMTLEEMDALGEIGNISMGSASTTLSELLSQKVNITSPRVKIQTKQQLFDSFNIPYLVIKVDFNEGLNGYNVLVIKLNDAATMASLMMGGDGTPMSEEISELEISAASEAMNMMIGTAATSLSQMFQRTINISPPQTNLLRSKGDPLAQPPQDIEDVIVVVSFDMKIGDLVDTEIMQIMSVETAKEEAHLLLKDIMGGTEEQVEAPMVPTEAATSATSIPGSDDRESDELAGIMMQETAPPPTPAMPPQAAPIKQTSLASLEQRNLDLILDIPLKVSVILGRTKRPIKDVLKIAPGSVVELDSLADEPVDILVNGTLVATGEVVVVNENFGIRITNIISPMERVKRLSKYN